MMPAVQQQTPAPSAPPPPRAATPAPLDGDELARRIEDAVTKGLEQASANADQGQAVRDGIRGTIEEIRAQVEAARAQGVEGIVVRPQFGDNVIPPGAVDISIAFFVMTAFVIVGLPLARAFARRMDRKGASAAADLEIAPRLDRIEQAIEAMAIEVERVSEGQRYTTKAIADLRGLPAAAPAAWPAPREAERIPGAEPRRP